MIYGLTHDETGRPRQRVAVSRKVAIGRPPTTGQNYPQKLDHFIVSRKDAKGEWIDDEDFMGRLAARYSGGDPAQLRAFDVVLLSDDIEQVFRTRMALWSQTALLCRGDGHDAERRADLKPEGAYAAHGPCSVGGCAEFAAKKCKPSGDLYFMFADDPVIGAVAVYHTTGHETIMRVRSSLEQIASLTGGMIRGIPLTMVVRPYRTKYVDPKTKTAKTSQAWAVSLEFRASNHGTVASDMVRRALAYRPGSPPLIEAATDADASWIGPEYHPEPDAPAYAEPGEVEAVPLMLADLPEAHKKAISWHLRKQHGEPTAAEDEVQLMLNAALQTQSYEALLKVAAEHVLSAGVKMPAAMIEEFRGIVG